jgi:hypothetical protein
VASELLDLRFDRFPMGRPRGLSGFLRMDFDALGVHARYLSEHM